MGLDLSGDVGGGGFDDAFTAGDDGDAGDPGAVETSSSTAGAGTKEAPAETALSSRMKELGLDDDAAARLLGERQEDAELERQEENEQRIHQEVQNRINRDFHGMFQQGLKQYMSDPGFRRNLASMLSRWEPAAMRGRMGAPGGQGEDETLDPTTRTVAELHARTLAQDQKIEALERRLREGAEAQTQSTAYKEGVGSEIDVWARRNASLAQEYGEEIMGDLMARERAAGGKSFRSGIELRRYLTERAEHYRKLDQKYASRAGGNRQRTTRPPGGNTGTPRGQAPRREQSDLRLPAITAGVLEDMARYRDSGGE